MARLNHKQKVKLARRLRTEKERKEGVALFYSYGWRFRKWMIGRRVAQRQALASGLAAARRASREAKRELQ